MPIQLSAFKSKNWDQSNKLPKVNLCELILGNSIIQRMSIFSKKEEDPQNPVAALHNSTAVKPEAPRRGSFFQVF